MNEVYQKLMPPYFPIEPVDRELALLILLDAGRTMRPESKYVENPLFDFLEDE